MDGPNTNWKFIKSLKRYGLENEQHQLIYIYIGSCLLHIIHEAFKAGVGSTNWELKKVLKGTFTLLRDSPAREMITFHLLDQIHFPCFFA